jgi:SAM-dependent methyltransferase
MIPKILHYCFGMAADFGGQPWSLVNYVCVKSAVEQLNPSKVYFWCEYVPKGQWWRLTEGMVEVLQIRAPVEISGNPLLHPAHRADVVRLEKLIELGGIYLDADVFVHRDFDDLLHHRVVMGKEVVRQGETGLCNAVILAESGASFLCRWHEAYKTFRSRGRDEFWSEHSVGLPMRLASQFPDEITTLPPSAFFSPSWSEVGIERIFNSVEPIPSVGRYANHLWAGIAWEKYLEGLTPRRVRKVDSNFHIWARPLVSTLPDDYGAAAAIPRVAKRAREAAVSIRNPGRFLSPAWHATNRAISSLFPDSNLARLYRRRVFRHIYEWKSWGLDRDGGYSGVGSTGEPAKVYVETMALIIVTVARVFREETTVVDLGCGDFRVGASLLARLPPIHYVGCDIVPEIIAENTRRYGAANVTFRCLDIVADDLPPGHVYLVRRVLQHLPNRDIAKVLAKLSAYQNVYVTEGQPEIREGAVNPDMPVGAEVRFNRKSGRGRGVELDQAPYNFSVEEVCRASPESEISREVIITYRLRPRTVERAEAVKEECRL